MIELLLENKISDRSVRTDATELWRRGSVRKLYPHCFNEIITHGSVSSLVAISKNQSHLVPSIWIDGATLFYPIVVTAPHSGGFAVEASQPNGNKQKRCCFKKWLHVACPSLPLRPSGLLSTTYI